MSRIFDYFEEGYTCILYKDGSSTFLSKEKGIKPMIDFISQGLDLKEYQAYDLIVGKAVALLFVYAGINYVYGKVISTSAIEVLEKYGIKHDHQTLTDRIINRMGTDICPMEKAVQNIEDPTEAYQIIRDKV